MSSKLEFPCESRIEFYSLNTYSIGINVFFELIKKELFVETTFKTC